MLLEQRQEAQRPAAQPLARQPQEVAQVVEEAVDLGPGLLAVLPAQLARRSSGAEQRVSDRPGTLWFFGHLTARRDVVAADREPG